MRNDALFYDFFYYAFGDLLFSTAKKVGKKAATARGAFHLLLCFYERKPPSPARVVPTLPRVPHAPPHTPNITTPTTQRPTPPVGEIEV